MKKTHSFLRDELKLSTAVTLVVCTLMSGSLLYGQLTGGGDDDGGRRKPSAGNGNSGRQTGGSGGDEMRCYLQEVPCQKLNQTCRMLPYALELRCVEQRCKDGALCVPTPRVGLPGQEGFDFYLKSICSLTINPCPITDVSCIASPVISQVSCDDERCGDDLLTVSGNTICERTRVIVDRNGNVAGPFNGWVPADNQGGSSGGSGGEIAGSINPGGSTGGSNTSGDVPGIFGESSGGQSGGERPTVPTNTGNSGPARGCFTRNGVWTTDRAFCDPDQGRFLGGEDTEDETTGDDDVKEEVDAQRIAEQETEVRRLVESKFRTKEERDAQLQSLLATTTDAIERLSLLVNRQVLPVETAQHIQAMIDWLKQVMTTYSLGDYSMEQIHTEAVRVHKSLEDTQFLITKSFEQSGVSLQRDPNTLLSKTDRIFMAIPTVLSLLQEQQVPVAPEALTIYQEASALYEEIKPVCLRDTDQCLRLVGVVERLQQMMDTLRTSMNTAGRSDLEEKINILFQSM